MNASLTKNLNLCDEQWMPVSFHLPCLAFLRSEWKKFSTITDWVKSELITDPNLEDVSENQLRTYLLWSIRGPLLKRVPPDTQWFEVRNLRRAHFHELHVMGRCGWDDPADRNELLRFAQRKPESIRGDIQLCEPPILWGHDRNGPFTILEGNHRLTAIAGDSNEPFDMPCYVGLSKQPCFWHLSDAFVDS